MGLLETPFLPHPLSGRIRTQGLGVLKVGSGDSLPGKQTTKVAKAAKILPVFLALFPCVYDVASFAVKSVKCARRPGL
jgi:hypothetical protein